MSGFYARLCDRRGDDDRLRDCIETVINRLEEGETSEANPGMLLGKIQSGKTRAFLGVIARAFDRDFDIALVFTKGTKTLARQTVRRISSDFKLFIDDDEMLVYDIMEMPGRMTRSELKRKLVIVAKKQAKNLDRVLDLFSNIHPELANRRVLLVDDEADLASVRFVKKRNATNYTQGAIAQQMDDLRRIVPNMAFLQVTATPYALYLQPEDYSPGANDFTFYPKRPAFTELLPIHSGYVGGDDYFGEHPDGDPRNFLFVAVPESEQNALRVPDGRVIRDDRIWTSDNIAFLRRALMTFLLAVVVRRWQQALQEQRLGKFAMIIHNDTQRSAHNWQDETVEKILHAFEGAIDVEPPQFGDLFNEVYGDLHASVSAHGGRMPSLEDARRSLKELIVDQDVNVQRVNSDALLASLLDPETAELKLRTQANIFIGGSILDRGITIPALISFYYGRNPRTMQADTVLQHSRMYGNRDRADVAVTRFYTSEEVYTRLEQIHKLETALRDAFEGGAHERGVVFVQNDSSNRIIPCSPSKVAVSEVVTIRGGEFYLPTGFDTHREKVVQSAHRGVLDLLSDYPKNAKKFSEIPLDDAIAIILRAKAALKVGRSSDFDWNTMTGLLRYFCKVAKSDQVLLLAETGRNLNREKSGDKSGLSIIGTGLRDLVRAAGRAEPALIFLEQNGSKRQGWSGNNPFWWPILAAPSDVVPCVFANAVAKD
ncbi:Z1 domain-containing protein [Burkholderia gladioli]|uniref:Z1 domain-containing protein n=1 Tax=Burkholderia gladioli TaxID=28095 RepID=UPI000D008A47|nr:Z1 domain-containing protein [Burkholderia gladioli]MBA1365423.1 hypothetical protein [Burkholderia gladioli]PRG50543.1 hypothetical protein C6V06_21380 [Burkholderia gladioli]